MGYNAPDFINKSWKYVLLFAIISVPIFSQLGSFPLRMWDEARLAENAYEMYHNGNFITTYSRGNPDMWNTKPPLMIWCQVLSMKVFGVNEFAVRFPSALAAFFTCMALLIFSLRYMKSFWFGFICVIIMITLRGYVGEHVIRTGDYDSLLTLFTTLSLLSFFIFIDIGKNKYLYGFFTFMALAVLTKSIAGLIFLPAIFAHFVLEHTITGWTSLMVTSLIVRSTFIGGIQLLSRRIIGKYISRINRNVLNRPLYIVGDTNIEQ